MRRLLQLAAKNSIALGVVVIVLFLILPLPAELLDVLLVINIALSIMILLITMNITEALEFSIFPSLLLITTLQVIAAFGALITSGNIVIGFIIFFIIVLVQFLVITKGAERVAEVAARRHFHSRGYA